MYNTYCVIDTYLVTHFFRELPLFNAVDLVTKKMT